MLGVSKTVFERLSYWAPTLSSFGACGGLGILYFTDWKAVLQYVPIYNTKFTPKE